MTEPMPEPTAANFFAFISEDEYSHEARDQILARWKDEGVEQIRVTLVNAEHTLPPYPHGFWLEGWTDGKARMLPFGHVEGNEWGPVSPPLVDSQTGNLLAAQNTSGALNG